MKYKFLWNVAFLPTVVTFVAIQFMEDNVPMHYDYLGNIDRWGSKYESFILPIIIIITTVFWMLYLIYFNNKQRMETDEIIIKEAQMIERALYYLAIGMAIILGLMHYFYIYLAII